MHCSKTIEVRLGAREDGRERSIHDRVKCSGQRSQAYRHNQLHDGR